MLELQNLTVGFDGESILKNINMIFKPGEVTVITGHSGTGKSSLLKVINGIIPEYNNAELEGDIVHNFIVSIQPMNWLFSWKIET